MSPMSCPSTGTADKPGAASTSSAVSPTACSLGWGCGPTALNKNAGVGFGLGVPTSPLELLTSMDPKDYVWGTPSQQQQQNLFQQFMQMAFFWHMAQNASLSSGQQGVQPQMPMFPFGFSPMGPMGPMPFNPAMMPPFPGFPQAAPGVQQQCPAPTSAPLPCAAPNFNAQQMVAGTSTAGVACAAPSASLPIPQQQQPAALQLPCLQPTDSCNTTAMNNNVASSPASVHLQSEHHDCDAIDLLLADVDLFPSSKAMHSNNNNMGVCDQAGSPCSLSGSDGSTATVDSLFTSDLDSPVSGDPSQAHAGLYDASADLCLSDADFDAVMDGITGPSHFELSIDDYDLISLDAPVQQPQQQLQVVPVGMPSAPAPAAATAPVAAKAKAPARPRKAGGGGKAGKVQGGGVAKAEKRSKAKGDAAVGAALGAVAAAAAATAAAPAGGSSMHGVGSLLGAIVQ